MAFLTSKVGPTRSGMGRNGAGNRWTWPPETLRSVCRRPITSGCAPEAGLPKCMDVSHRDAAYVASPSVNTTVPSAPIAIPSGEAPAAAAGIAAGDDREDQTTT